MYYVREVKTHSYECVGRLCFLWVIVLFVLWVPLVLFLGHLLAIFHLLTMFLAAYGFLKINNTFCHISVERSLGRIFLLGTFGHRVLLMQFLCRLEDTVVSNRSQSNSRVNYRRKRWLLTAGQIEGLL